MAIGAILGGAGAGAGISIVIKAIDQFSKPMKKMENGLKKQEKGFAKLTKFVKANSLVLMAAAGAMVGFAVSAVKSALKSEQAFQSFRLVVGATADALLEDMKRASRGMISDFDLVNSANAALALGIKETDIPGLLEVATARAKVFGRSATDAFNDLTIGIGRQSRMILDNLGIILDLDKVYEDYAETIGKTKEEVRDLYAKEALANAIMEESKGLVMAQNFLLETHAEQIAKVTTRWKNFKDAIGEWLLNAYDVISGQKLMNETIKTQVDMVTGIPGTYDTVSRAIMDLDRAQKSLTDSLKSSNIEAQSLIDSLLNLSDIAFKGERVKSLEIAKQKEVIRGLELRALRGEDVGEELEKERNLMKEMRLESERYSIAREIQQAKNAIGLEKIGEIEVVNFNDFAKHEQDKFDMLEIERDKQQLLRGDIERIGETRERMLEIFEDVTGQKLLGYQAEEESINSLIERIEATGLAYVEAAKKQAEMFGPVPSIKGLTPLEAADVMAKAAKDREHALSDEFETQRAINSVLAVRKLGGITPISPGIPIAEAPEPKTKVGKILATVGKLVGIGPFRIFQKGGIVPETGPALVHKGETIIPAGKGAGVTIYINNLNGFNARDIANNLQDELEGMIKT